MTPQDPPQVPIRTIKAFDSSAVNIQHGHAGFVFTCSNTNKLALHDTNSGEQVISLDTASQAPSTIAVSADGVKAAYGTETGVVYIWDVLYPTSMESFRPDGDHAEPITELAWHPRGHVLAVATESGNIYLWDLVVGTLLYPIPAHRGAVSAIAWTANGRLLVSTGASDSTLQVWNPRKADNLVNLSADSEDKEDLQWHKNGITCLDTLPDMSRVAITGGGDGTVLLSVLKPETTCGIFHTMNPHKSSSVTAVRFSHIDCPKPLRASSAASDGSIHLFDMDRRLPMGKFSHGTTSVKQLEFSTNADVLFSAAGNTVIAWDARVAPEEEIPVIFGGQSVEVQAFAVINNGTGLVTACQDGLLRVYDVRYPSGEAVVLNAESS